MARSAPLNQLIQLDKNAPEPLYQQVIRAVREGIAQGALRPGDKLPPTRDLAEQLGIARQGVVNAYTELLSEGVLIAYAGRGTYIAGEAIRSDPSTLPSLAANPAVASIKPEMIAFAGGSPAEEFLPVAALRRSIEAVLARDGAAAVAYEETEGYPPLRAAVASYLDSLGIPAKPSQVLITGGCQQALDLAIQSLLNAGDTLLTTNPTYTGILDICRIRRVNVIGVPCDAQGMKTDLLESYIEQHRPKLIYSAPTHHNPTGTVMPTHRRRMLLRIAADARIPILEDGVYHELNYNGDLPLPLKALDEYGVVIHANGFSKIVLPGTRIGYLIAEGEWWERALRVKQAADICTPGLNQRAMHHFLVSGVLAGHLDRVRSACRIRRDAAVAAARQHLPQGSNWNVPTGGVYLWVKLPQNGVTAAQLYAAALRQGVTFAMGAEFFTEATSESPYYMRLNFAAQPPERIEEGMARLGAAYRQLIP